MRRYLVLFLVLLFTISGTFADSVKVYDEYGNRVGTYKKEGDNYQFYDFNDRKIDTPETVIENPPDKRTLTEYSQIFYDENMIPIGSRRSGFYGNDGRYYPRYSEYYPASWYRRQNPYIVRPRANSINNIQHPHYRNNVNYIDTRYPQFHKINRPQQGLAF